MITKAYLSPFNNIYQNLCLEDYFLRHSEEEFILFYINEPCVVMGNFQNPWLETNLPLLTEHEVCLARRQSGGGTVFHDEGNLNFCFFRNKNILTEEDKNSHLKMIRDLLADKGIVTEKLPKSGMVFIKDDTKYKFSGEAFKQTKERSFHHGTLLVQSDLKRLEDCLSPSLEKIKTKAVPSNPHLVGNLAMSWDGLTPLSFYQEFLKFHSLDNYEADYSKLHRFVMDKADDWADRRQVLRKTPEFEVRQNRVTLTVVGGRVIAEDHREVEARDFSL